MTACTLLSVDLDGTLVDTAGEIAEAVNRTLDDFGVARRPAAQITRLIGRGTRELMLRLLAELMHEQPALVERLRVDEMLARLEYHYALAAGSSGVVYPGARDAMLRLAAAGVRLACVTNKELRHARRVLQATRLVECFELVVGGDSLAHKKPHHSVLQHVLDAFGVPREQMAHVGDSAVGLPARWRTRSAARSRASWLAWARWRPASPARKTAPVRFRAAPSEFDPRRASKPSTVPAAPIASGRCRWTRWLRVITEASSDAGLPVLVTRSAYFAHEDVGDAMAAGDALAPVTGLALHHAPGTAPAAPRIGLALVEQWHSVFTATVPSEYAPDRTAAV